MTNEQYKECEGYKEEAIKEPEERISPLEAMAIKEGKYEDYMAAQILKNSFTLDTIREGYKEEAIKEIRRGDVIREVYEKWKHKLPKQFGDKFDALGFAIDASCAIKEYCEEGWEIHKMEDEQDCESIQKLDNMVFPQGEALEQNFPEGQ